MLEYIGKAFCFGDDINTDYIISSRRKKDTIDPYELVPYIMEDIRPDFARELSPVSILVAGNNFGCGSAMEVAAQIVHAAGITVILAKSFARSYYRNAINNGILIVEMNTDGIKEGDMIRVTMDNQEIIVHDQTNGYSVKQQAYSGKIFEILTCGGLIPYMINKK